MRLETYLNERLFNQKLSKKKTLEFKQEQLDMIIPILKQNCSEILSIYKSSNKMLMRTIKDYKQNPEGRKLADMNAQSFIEKRMRTGVRKPKDTPVNVHRALNTLFKEKFGWKVRDGIFTASTVPTWGETYLFFPANKFKFVWSPKYRDLYADLSHKLVNADKKEIEANMKAYKRVVNTFKDNDLVAAIKSNNEVVFKMKTYYLVHAEYRDMLQREL